MKKVFIILMMSSLSHAKTMICTETAKSSTENGYGRNLKIEVSMNAQTIKISADATKDYKAFDEVVRRDDSDTSNDENGNLDEQYNRKLEARFIGSNNISTSDVGTCVFVSRNILSGKPGQLRLTGGQGNDSDNGPMILWFEDAILDCK